MLDVNELSKKWNQILIIRELKDDLSTYESKSLSDTEFAMLCHIAHQNGNANITSIAKHPYFAVTSLSTVKRAVVRLMSEGLIRTNNTSPDRRENMLEVVDNG